MLFAGGKISYARWFQTMDVRYVQAQGEEMMDTKVAAFGELDDPQYRAGIDPGWSGTRTPCCRGHQTPGAAIKHAAEIEEQREKSSWDNCSWFTGEFFEDLS